MKHKKSDEEKIADYYDITAFINARRQYIRHEDKYTMSTPKAVRTYILQLERQTQA